MTLFSTSIQWGILFLISICSHAEVRRCDHCTPKLFQGALGLDNYGMENVDMSCELELDDYDAPNPMSIDAQDRFTEPVTGEQMLAYERRRSYERAGSAGGGSLDSDAGAAVEAVEKESTGSNFRREKNGRSLHHPLSSQDTCWQT